MRLALPFTCLGLLLAPTGPGRAQAAEAGEWIIGLSPSYAYVVLEQQGEPRGGGGSLFLHYGITSSLGFRFFGLWSAHEIEGTEKNPGGTYQVLNLALGLRYALDLVDLSPAIELGIGILHHRFGDEAASDVGIHAGLALDYWLLRWLGVGAAFHYHAFLTNPTQYPVYFDTGPRLSVRWR